MCVRRQEMADAQDKWHIQSNVMSCKSVKKTMAYYLIKKSKKEKYIY